MIKKRIIYGKEIDVVYPDRWDWISNMKFDSLNSDPFLIIKYKKIRKFYRKWKNRILTFLFITYITILFHLFGFNDLIKDNVYYIDICVYLTLVTLIGIFIPANIMKEGMSEKDTKEFIEKMTLEKEKDEKIKKRATLSGK